MTEPRLRVLRVRGERDADLALPSRSTPGSAGLDLPAALDGEVELPPGGRAVVPTGFALAVPSGFEGQVRPRSGLAAEHGVTLLNAPGTIDADFRGEVRVILVNLGSAPFRIRRGDRIAQLVIAPVAAVAIEEVDHPDGLGATRRGRGGLGHTGR